jgi:hypothetical protein
MKYNQKNHTNVSNEDFIDKTGYECFVNSINIDELVEKDYCAQGLLFCSEVFNKWKKESDEKLMSIFIADELSLKIKFHVKRKGENWLSPNFEKYEEEILIISSDEDVNNLCK